MTFWAFILAGLFCAVLGAISYALWEDDDDHFL